MYDDCVPQRREYEVAKKPAEFRALPGSRPAGGGVLVFHSALQRC